MANLVRNLEGLIGTGKTYPHVSQNMAYNLRHTHDMSLKKFPYDMADAMPNGQVLAGDGFFFARERSQKHPLVQAGTVPLGDPASLPAAGDKIAMIEWPTQARLRNFGWQRTVAETDADFEGGNLHADGSDQWDHVSEYFAIDTVAAFPSFNLWVEDPNDADFTPMLIGIQGDMPGREGWLKPWAAMAMFLNRRKYPLMISARVTAAVPMDSALILEASFVRANN